MSTLTIAEIRRLIDNADDKQFEALERSLEDDQRLGVKRMLASARARMDSLKHERERVASLYDFQNRISADHNAKIVVGIDEVGRGPLAGPLCVGAVVLSDESRICGLNDSKQVSEKNRFSIAEEIKATSVAWSVEFVSSREIDSKGMTKSLREAFAKAVKAIESKGVLPDLILLDGNPLRFDDREVNVVKGDSKCASIAAASIVAKVERDILMEKLDEKFPQYGFAKNKGYGTSDHREAIRKYGLSEIHRVSFCSEFTQQTLF